jgi:hypothetical protein
MPAHPNYDLSVRSQHKPQRNTEGYSQALQPPSGPDGMHTFLQPHEVLLSPTKEELMHLPCAREMSHLAWCVHTHQKQMHQLPVVQCDRTHVAAAGLLAYSFTFPQHTVGNSTAASHLPQNHYRHPQQPFTTGCGGSSRATLPRNTEHQYLRRHAGQSNETPHSCSRPCLAQRPLNRLGSLSVI